MSRIEHSDSTCLNEIYEINCQMKNWEYLVRKRYNEKSDSTYLKPL